MFRIARAHPRLVVALAVSAAFATAVGAPASAEETGAEERGLIEEIIVTATYRETELMKTPQAISAVSDALVEDLGAQSMEDLYTMIPGLSMQGALNGQARYTIRGVSSQSGHIGYAPTGATIGVYLDGTPVTAALGPDNQISGTLFDIERVEVLKGPQGTLFGEGSQGGTIRYLYKKPDATAFDAAANLGFSSMAESDDMSNRLDGMINVPLSDAAALRLTAWRAETAGFIENLEPFEEDFNTAETTGVRAALRYEGDRLTVTGTVHHSVQETQGGLGTFRAYEALHGRIPGLEPESEDTVDIYSLDVEWDLGWAMLHSLTSFTDRQIPSVSESSETGARTLDYYYGGAALADPDDPACLALVAFGIPCPGWPGAFSFAGLSFTGDGMNLQAISNIAGFYSERWVQEFRLVSPADKTLRWTAGFFWKDSEDHTQNQQKAGYHPGREAFGLVFDPLLRVPANTHTDFLEEYAVFGEASWDITETLEITLGVRVSNLEQEFTNTGTGTDDTPVSPKLVLSWLPRDDLLLYFNYTTGFRPGNVNNNLDFYISTIFEPGIESARINPAFDDATRAAVIAGLEQNIADSLSRLFFDGDKLDNYEIGLKATLWGGRATVLASAYYLDWKDMLVYVNDPAIAPGGDSHNANSGGAEITGFELELNAFVTDRFSVRLAGDINESEVTEVGVPFQNAEDGNELRYAPGDSMSIALDYSIPVGGDWMLDLHLDHAWVAKQFADSQNQVVVPSYEKTNARATLRSADQKWRVALFVTNLANDEILRGRDLLATLYWHNPRQIGLEVGYQM